MKTLSLSLSLRRSVISTLAVIMLMPTSILLLTPSDADARGRAGGVAVRGPRGGGVAVGGASRGRVAAPRAAAPAVRGTARRTARRTTRRMYTLPRGYTRRTMYGVSYYYYSGVYYEAYYEGSTVVYVEVVFN